MKSYKGFKISGPVTATQVGYAPPRRNKKTHTVTQRTRKTTGYTFTDVDGYERWADTLQEAIERIDHLTEQL